MILQVETKLGVFDLKRARKWLDAVEDAEDNNEESIAIDGYAKVCTHCARNLIGNVINEMAVQAINETAEMAQEGYNK